MLLRFSILTLPLIAILSAASLAIAQAPSPPEFVSASVIAAEQLIQPAALGKLLNGQPGAPLIIQVGSRIFFQEAHISGSKYAGPGSQPSGLQLLEKTVDATPKDTFIVLYCGCCPWGRCPNVGPAFQRLHQLGYSNVKVLYLANNFGDDWVRNGFPREH